jgi:mono/diheme cytochrome c family protein
MNHPLVRLGSVGFTLLAVLFLFTPPARAQIDASSLFKSKCAACHGTDGSGNTPGGKSMKIRDFHSADVQEQTDAQLTDLITNGKGAMPAYKGKLPDDQIKQLVVYIRTLAKK